MKRYILVLGTLLLLLCSVETAYAGDLNQYEKTVIASAQEIYEYKGEQYKADQVYIDKLIEYLSRDDIDLTEADMGIILETAYNSIETGVDEGYLKPVPRPTITDQPSEEKPKPSPEEPSEGESKPSPEEPSEKDQKPSSEEPSEEEPKSSLEEPSEEETKSSPDKPSGEDPKTSPEISTMDNDENIIKQTGFRLNQSLIILVGMGLLMLAGLFVTLKLGFFAHDYE